MCAGDGPQGPASLCSPVLVRGRKPLPCCLPAYHVLGTACCCSPMISLNPSDESGWRNYPHFYSGRRGVTEKLSLAQRHTTQAKHPSQKASGRAQAICNGRQGTVGRLSCVHGHLGSCLLHAELSPAARMSREGREPQEAKRKGLDRSRRPLPAPAFFTEIPTPRGLTSWVLSGLQVRLVCFHKPEVQGWVWVCSGEEGGVGKERRWQDDIFYVHKAQCEKPHPEQDLSLGGNFLGPCSPAHRAQGFLSWASWACEGSFRVLSANWFL